MSEQMLEQELNWFVCWGGVKIHWAQSVFK